MTLAPTILQYLETQIPFGDAKDHEMMKKRMRHGRKKKISEASFLAGFICHGMVESLKHLERVKLGKTEEDTAILEMGSCIRFYENFASCEKQKPID
jgi:hypothetical protein